MSTSLKQEVIETLAYFAFFSYKPTRDEVYLFLHSHKPASSKDVYKYYQYSVHDKSRQKLIDRKTQKAQLAIRFLKILPTIQFIGITGSVGANNPKPDDDIDLIIVCSPDTLWFTRALVSILVLFQGTLRRSYMSHQNANDLICPNLWLDTHNLSLSKNQQNIYTAHEILQIKSLFDRGGVYQKLLQENYWIKHYLYNGYNIKFQNNISEVIPRSNAFLTILNDFFYFLQYQYMKKKITTEKIGKGFAFFHQKDYHSLIKKHLQND